jgi:type I restriction enzyme, R subunit
MERVVADIVFDFSVKPRLSSERGNAILVASSIFEACKYFELFQHTPLKNRCAVITSYNPHAGDVSKEETGANTETDKQVIYDIYTRLLQNVTAAPGKSQTETYEDASKRQFIREPALMRLLVVVDKLLTGFDAPACTYLYIDKSMQDHGLFQAICRTNRLDGDDKEFGYIVDYKDLFKKLVNEDGTGALQVYSSELDHSDGGASPEVMMQDRVEKGRERLEQALEQLELLCAPVQPPKGELQHIHYFCGNTEIPSDLKEREPHRVALYKATVSLIRAWANLADEAFLSGYSESEIAGIKRQLKHYLDLREAIRLASGETLDLKPFEADMRHLLDTYIEADTPRVISPFDGIGLLSLIERTGLADAIAKLPDGIRDNPDSVAETIENNVRSRILKEQLNDPAYYERMSQLLDEVIRDRREKAITYEQYLHRIAALTSQVQTGHDDDIPEPLKRSAGLRAIFNNLSDSAHVSGETHAAETRERYTLQRLTLALDIDKAVKRERLNEWRGNAAKENHLKREALLPLLGSIEEVERMFLIIKQQPEY